MGRNIYSQLEGSCRATYGSNTNTFFAGIYVSRAIIITIMIIPSYGYRQVSTRERHLSLSFLSFVIIFSIICHYLSR